MSFRASVVMAFGLVMYGCSGASSPEIPLSDTSSTEPAITAQAGGRTGSASSSSTADAGASDDEADPEEPKPEEPACTPEAEPNNSVERATRFTVCAAGKVSGSTDADFFRVVVPAKKKKLVIDHEETGKVRYRVYRERAPWPLNADDDFTTEQGEVSVAAGETLIVRVSYPTGETGTAERAYELNVAFK